MFFEVIGLQGLSQRPMASISVQIGARSRRAANHLSRAQKKRPGDVPGRLAEPRPP